jgi:hypothetical protein
MWLFVTAAVLTACGDSRPQKCQRLESDFAEARQAWLDARAEVSDLSSQRGAIVSSSEEEEMADLRTELRRARTSCSRAGA